MNNDADLKFEQVADETVRLWEQGKTETEIALKFPDYDFELREFFCLLKAIDRQKMELLPRKELLKKILRELPEAENRNQNPIVGILNFFRAKAAVFSIVGVIFLVVFLAGLGWKAGKPNLNTLNKSAPVDKNETAFLESKERTKRLVEDIVQLEKGAADFDQKIKIFEKELNELEKLLSKHPLNDLEAIL